MSDSTTRPGTPPLLQLADVACDIAGNRIVEQVSFSLAPGELACLLGPSGCGKTTLLRAVAGFQALAHGSIALRGREVANVRGGDAPERRGVGFVFQDLALFPHLRVDANVGFGLDTLARGDRAARIDQTLALLGLDGLQRRFPHELSGGQQQRVALARSLAPQPDLLLLDEPFSSLDAHLRVNLRTELREVLKRLGIAALLVTHDQDEAFGFADTLGVMHAGRLLQWGTGFDVYHRPATAFVAKFVGEGRLLRARVLDASRIDTAVGAILTPDAMQAAPGSEAHLLLRPDDVRPANGDGFETTVVAASFRGAETFYTLRLHNGEEIAALFPSHLRYAVGQTVHARLDLQHVVVFAD
ncbi:ABC transporter ATP-binding protein [Chiayiivirga flava]|uniref:Iron(III) transport system ATP-binding protein n=1 Tax=Chiayiivirga flava TaxID=659595 RepID=A0A7W8DA38_9GAMM|nr:ABC transporter ATP-binding protein [Chiayiivirga flava]MBB5209356.1 iron(III) transport system ATP-binding protein [Chiayiivirga flava]